MPVKHRTLILIAATLAAAAARAALPVTARFSGVKSEHAWPLKDLNAELPNDWRPYEFLVLEFKASSSQRFDLGLETATGRLAKRIGSFAGVWVRAAIPLRFYREPAGSAIDLGRFQPAAQFVLDQHRRSQRERAHDGRPWTRGGHG